MLYCCYVYTTNVTTHLSSRLQTSATTLHRNIDSVGKRQRLKRKKQKLINGDC